jgi:hypothetical protein
LGLVTTNWSLQMRDHDDEIPSIETADLEGVTGGLDMSSMLPLMMMGKRNQQAAAPQQVAAAPAAPPKPKLFVDGVEQSVSGSNGNYTVDDV